MIMRIVKALFVSICLFVFSSGFETAAFAGGGGGGGGEGLTAPKDKPAKTGAATKSKTAKEKDKAVRGSLRAIDLTLASLEREAKKNNLRGIATNLRRITTLRIGIDTMYDELDGTKYRNDPQKITDLLVGFSKSKTNPELAFFAKGLLQAMAAEREYSRALEAAGNYNKARKAGDVKGEVEHRVEYEDAREDFHRKADRMNRKLRDRLFDKLPTEVPRF